MYGEPVTIEGTELLARAIQHETDHLDGVLFIDRLDRSAQGRDEGHPRGRVVRSRAADRQGSPHPTNGLGREAADERRLRRHPRGGRARAGRIAASRHELVGVVTRPDAPAGRGRKLVASPVAGRAEELGVPSQARAPPRPGLPARAARPRARRCPVVAYGALLPQSALDIPPHGWINLHFSVLPAGAAPLRCSTRSGPATRSPARRRSGSSRSSTPGRLGVMTETVRPDRHRRRPARAAGRGRRRAPGADPRRHRGRHPRGARAAGGWGSLAPRSGSRTRGSTGPAAAGRPQVRACTPPPAHGHLRGRADQARPASPVDREPLAPGQVEATEERRRSSAPAPAPVGSAGSRRSGRSRCRRPTGPAGGSKRATASVRAGAGP